LAEGISKGVCFAAGTKVATSEGDKPIEELKEGDIVLSSDAERGESAYERVSRVYVREASEMLDIRVEGEEISSTLEHLFWVEGKGWTAAKELKAGSELLTKEGCVARVEAVSRREGKFKVYNFEVERLHTYFVSRIGILVHNHCGAKLPELKPLHKNLIQTKLDQLRKVGTDDLIESLRPGAQEPLTVKPDGTIMQGNHRIKVLQERGVDVNKLPREIYSPQTP
jgi:intein/homing endonuclease